MKFHIMIQTPSEYVVYLDENNELWYTYQYTVAMEKIHDLKNEMGTACTFSIFVILDNL